MGVRRYKYSRDRIDATLARMLIELGPDQMSNMKLLELEKLVRDREKDAAPLPGRTQLREAINNFRSKRWPHCAPKYRWQTPFRD
jgi:hypothetical protein